MYLYLSLTREPEHPRTWLTPVVAVHAGIAQGTEIGLKNYTGESMWKDLCDDLNRMSFGGQAKRNVHPVGFDVQMSWATVVANLYRRGLRIDRSLVQPLDKKWQDADTFELSRAFTQCAYPRDIWFSEKDAFSFIGMKDAYLDEDARLVLYGDTFSPEERDASISRYMKAVVGIHLAYMAFAGEEARQ